MRKELMDVNPNAYKDEYAATLTNFGIFYRETGSLEESIKRLEKAKTLDEQLAETDKNTYEPFLAACDYELGLLYLKTNQEKKAKSLFEEAMRIYEKRETDSDPNIEKVRIALEKVVKKIKPKQDNNSMSVG